MRSTDSLWNQMWNIISESPGGRLFRSEPMQLINLILPETTAAITLEFIGEQQCLHLIDVRILC